MAFQKPKPLGRKQRFAELLARAEGTMAQVGRQMEDAGERLQELGRMRAEISAHLTKAREILDALAHVDEDEPAGVNSPN